MVDNELSSYDSLIDDLIKTHGKKGAMDALAKFIGYERPVPYILDFLDDPYYLGKILVDGDGNSSVYPIWRDAAVKLYPNPYVTSAFEVYLTGGIGLGKSTFAKIIVCYDICKLLCLKDPKAHFKLLPTTIIRYMLMNATKGLAFGVLYNEIIEWIENSPFFREYLSDRTVSLFKKGIDIGMGSRGNDALGQATVGAIFSEINDMTVVHDQATDVFDTIAVRVNSRFGGKGSPMIGHLILDSSNKGTKSFLDNRLEEKKKKGHTDFIVFRFAHWEAKWHLGHYSGKFFRVYAGDEHRDPFIIDDVIKNGKEWVINRDVTDPLVIEKLESSRIVEAPVEHYEEFYFNVVKALRDLAGVSTFGTWSFISSTEQLNKAFTHINPISKDVIVLDFFDPNQKLIDYINIDALKTLNNAPRFIHIDLGLKNDSTGISCTYLKGFKDITYHDANTGNVVVNREPVFFTEWVMEITAVPGHEVAIYKIKDFILEARKRGYPIKGVSTDGFQSSNLRQDLQLKKIDTSLISVDRTKNPYDYVKNAILEGRLELPQSKKVQKEFLELEDTGGKYDHPVGGSKDLIDSITGSVWNCCNNLDKTGIVIKPKDFTRSLDSLIAIDSPQEYFSNKLSGLF